MNTQRFQALRSKAREIDDRIDEDDYLISDCGPLGSKYYCSQVGEFGEWDDLIDAIKKDMDSSSFFPNIWYVNDHGTINGVTPKGEHL